MHRLTLIAVFLFFSQEAWCERARGKRYYALDAGVYVSHLEARVSAPEGHASDVSSLEGYLRFRPSWNLGKNWALETSLGVGVPGRPGADGSVRVFTLQLDTDVVAPLFSWLGLRLGPGLHSLLFFSGAEAVSLQNGSTTNFETYYTPGGIRMTVAVTFQAGLRFQLSQRIQLNVDAIMQSPLNSSRRSVDGVLSLGVVL